MIRRRRAEMDRRWLRLERPRSHHGGFPRSPGPRCASGEVHPFLFKVQRSGPFILGNSGAGGFTGVGVGTDDLDAIAP